MTRLRQPGMKGGLYGGGPELTVLSNILRRPISIYHLKQQQSQDQQLSTLNNRTKYGELERMGVFGEGLFEDQCQSIPDSVISNAVFFTVDGSKVTQQAAATQSSSATLEENASSILNNGISPIISSPLKCTWHLHVLIADSGENEKHASVLLPSLPILHNDPQRLKNRT